MITKYVEIDGEAGAESATEKMRIEKDSNRDRQTC
jgi:hypothetical protein